MCPALQPDVARDEIVLSTGSQVGGLLVDGLGDGAMIEAPSEDVEYLRTTAFGLLQVRGASHGCFNNMEF